MRAVLGCTRNAGSAHHYSQAGAQQAPASGTGRCRTTASALQALLLSLAGADSKHAGPRGVLLGWNEQRQRHGAKLSHPQVQPELRGWRDAVSPAEPGKKLPCLFVARGLEEGTGSRQRFTSVTLRVAGTLEKLPVPREAPQARASAPLQPLEPLLRTAPQPLRGREPASPRGRGAGRGHRADRQPGRAGAGRGRELRLRAPRRPGGCRSPRRAGDKGSAERRGRRLSLAPEGHQPNSSPHPGLHP